MPQKRSNGVHWEPDPEHCGNCEYYADCQYDITKICYRVDKEEAKTSNSN